MLCCIIGPLFTFGYHILSCGRVGSLRIACYEIMARAVTDYLVQVSDFCPAMNQLTLSCGRVGSLRIACYEIMVRAVTDYLVQVSGFCPAMNQHNSLPLIWIQIINYIQIGIVFGKQFKNIKLFFSQQNIKSGVLRDWSLDDDFRFISIPPISPGSRRYIM